MVLLPYAYIFLKCSAAGPAYMVCCHKYLLLFWNDCGQRRETPWHWLLFLQPVFVLKMYSS